MAIEFGVFDMDGGRVGTMELPEDAFVIQANAWGSIESVTLRDEYSADFVAGFVRVLSGLMCVDCQLYMGVVSREPLTWYCTGCEMTIVL